MASLFDDSSDEDEGEMVTTTSRGWHPSFNIVYARTLTFINSASEMTLRDLQGDVPAKLATGVCLPSSLRACVQLFLQVKSPPDAVKATGCLEACSKLSHDLWAELILRKTWPHKNWTEAFIFANLMGACCHLAENSSIESIKCADYAFMVGAPKEETNLLFRLVDKPVDREEQSRALVEKLLGSAGKESWNESDFSRLVSALSPYVSTQQVEKCQTTELEVLDQLCIDGGDTPRVFKGFTDGWSAMEQWRSLDYFDRRFGHRIVPVEVGNTITGMEEKALCLSDFLREFLAPSCRAQPQVFSVPAFLAAYQDESTRARQVGYLAQHNIFEQMPALQRDFSVPRFCSHNGRQLSRASIWFGTKSTVTLLHYDSYNNLLVQVAGYKYVILFPASETSKLYAKAESENNELLKQGNTSAINVALPDLGRHPLYARAKGFAVLLEPGDTLFIPRGMWHYVQALTPSLSVNFWMTYPE